jgi:hypothetical protein
MYAVCAPSEKRVGRTLRPYRSGVHLTAPRIGVQFHAHNTRKGFIMALMSLNKLSAQIRSIKGNAHKLRDQIQEALISCAYHAAKDGQTTPFNNLLEAVDGTARLKGITLWAELYGFVRVKDERLVINKKMRSEAGVTDEEDFKQFEADMRSGPKWYELAGKEPVKSMFDLDNYANTVEKKLTTEGYIGLAEAVKDLIQKYHAEQTAEISKLLEAELAEAE